MIDKRTSFQIDIYKVYINDNYGDDGYEDSGLFIVPARNYLNYEETNAIYAFLNELGYDVSNPEEFIESMIASLYKYYQAMIVASRVERLKNDGENNDDLYG
ncbi:MAG: hypothetical protein QXL94_00365 [Candidatus Parvarchaeum sp.]